MALSEKDITRIAELAKLKVSPEESARLLRDLNSILQYMEIVNQIDTDDIEMLKGNGATPLREDKVKPGLKSEEALKNAAETIDDFFAVPKVVDKQSNQ